MPDSMESRPSDVKRRFQGSVLEDEMLEAASYVFVGFLIDNGNNSWDTEVKLDNLITYVRISVPRNRYDRLTRPKNTETLQGLFTELVRRGYLTSRDADGTTYLTATQQYVEFFRHYPYPS